MTTPSMGFGELLDDIAVALTETPAGATGPTGPTGATGATGPGAGAADHWTDRSRQGRLDP